MIVTTYTCDRCGHAQTNDTQMWHVGIIVANALYNLNQTSIRERQLWCRECLMALNLFNDAKEPTPPAPPLPTFEEKLREILGPLVREMMEETP